MGDSIFFAFMDWGWLDTAFERIGEDSIFPLFAAIAFVIVLLVGTHFLGRELDSRRKHKVRMKELDIKHEQIKAHRSRQDIGVKGGSDQDRS